MEAEEYSGMLEPGQVARIVADDGSMTAHFFVYDVFPAGTKLYAAMFLLGLGEEVLAQDEYRITLNDITFLELSPDEALPVEDADLERVMLAFRIAMLRRQGDVEAIED